MFEDFKDKVCEPSQNEQNPLSASLSPEFLEKLKKEGIDPDNFTLKQLWPEVLDEDGNDLSLLSGAEWETLITYVTTRKYLVVKYPLTQQEAKMSGQAWEEEPGEPKQINIVKARCDSKAPIFYNAMLRMKVICDKLQVLQTQGTDYEKVCLRVYWHLTWNWNRAPNIDAFRATTNDTDIFETVDAYFKICKKYHQPTFEEPYYFLSEQKRRDIKLEGDMIKRTTDYSENEIRISILEGIP
jgi:hypothetical protein